MLPKFYLKIIKNLKNKPILFSNLYKSNFKGFDENGISNINKVANDMLLRKSKLFRYSYIYNYGNMLGIENENFIKTCSEMIEILHNGTLIIDDVEDNSKFRRSEICSHLKFGNGLSINTGIFMMNDVINNIINFKELNDEQKLKIYNIYHKYIQKLLVGLNSDISWGSNYYDQARFVKESDYLKMIEFKTSAIIIMMIEILNIYSNRNIEYIKEYTIEFGKIFQITDDYINLTSKKYNKTKGQFAEDITEGKITFINIHSFNNHNKEDQSRIVEILKMKTEDINIKNEFWNLMGNSNSLEYTRNYIDNNLNSINKEIKEIHRENKYIDNMISLSNYLINKHIK